MSKTISDNGKELIKHYEGMRKKAYKCPAGIWTIGYGHTGNVSPTQKITQAEANALFDEDIKKYEAYVNAGVKVEISQGLYDALVSFTYNLGPGAFNKSTLLKYVNQKKDQVSITNQFRRYVWGGGRKLPGLVRRREAEALLANGIPWNTHATITDQVERDEVVNVPVEPDWTRHESANPAANSTNVGSVIATGGAILTGIINNSGEYAVTIKETASELSGYTQYLPMLQNAIVAIMLVSLVFVVVNRTKKILESRR